jgi:hypothetical protein
VLLGVVVALRVGRVEGPFRSGCARQHARERARTVEDSLGDVAPSTSTASPTVQLTDQALVAVRMAQSLAGDARPTVGHLLAGLAGEPEGMAGRLLRQRFGETAARIALHDEVASPDLVPLSTAYVAVPVLDRPCWTLELLLAARRVGGTTLDELLQSCGIDLVGAAGELDPRMPTAADLDEGDDGPETFGLLSLVDVGFTHAADLAVARTRAHGGHSHHLLDWLGADSATCAALATAPAVPVQAVVDRARLSDMAVEDSDLVTAITHLTLRAALDRT